MDWKVKVTSRHEAVKSQLDLEPPLENKEGGGAHYSSKHLLQYHKRFYQYRRNKIYLKVDECIGRKIGISISSYMLDIPE